MLQKMSFLILLTSLSLIVNGCNKDLKASEAAKISKDNSNTLVLSRIKAVAEDGQCVVVFHRSDFGFKAGDTMKSMGYGVNYYNPNEKGIPMLVEFRWCDQ
jgi:hypothetical protein